MLKVAPLLSYPRYKFKRLFYIGKNISIYEHTIIFQGNQIYKLWITYNNIGYGFQNDSICEEGCTYTSVLHYNIIKISGNHVLFSLCERVVHLIWYLKHDSEILFMKNLYNLSTLELVSHK